MTTKDYLIENFKEDKFKKAFKEYFGELGIEVKRWDELFDEMNNDPNGKNYAYVRVSGDGEAVGFIQFTVLEVKSWFFEAEAGFVREFWISEKYRNLGYGSELLRITEEHFREMGLFASILTSDTAEKFYKNHGYMLMNSISAKNSDPVFAKLL